MWQPASERLQVRMWAAYGRWGGRNKRLTAATETRRAGAVCVCVCSPGRNAPLQMFPVRRDASPGCQQTSENDRRALKRAFFCPCLCVVTFCCYVSRYASQWGGWEEEGGAACNNLCLHCIPVQTHRWRAFFYPLRIKSQTRTLQLCLKYPHVGPEASSIQNPPSLSAGLLILLLLSLFSVHAATSGCLPSVWKHPVIC